MANPYASNQGMANSMASLPGAAPPNGYPGAAPTSPPAYAASPYAPDGKQPYVVTAPQAAAVPEQPSGGGFMQGQTFGVDNSTLAAGGAALGVGALGVAALSNGRPGARRKPSFRDRSAAVSEKCGVGKNAFPEKGEKKRRKRKMPYILLMLKQSSAICKGSYKHVFSCHRHLMNSQSIQSK